uniref:Protein aurora borealis n=1 Tax=Timema monikensis TaxID=170555 RepID=A0A7R9HNX0_9NEOP|nr:unnamed protein product [Timema monikensis]
MEVCTMTPTSKKAEFSESSTEGANCADKQIKSKNNFQSPLIKNVHIYDSPVSRKGNILHQSSSYFKFLPRHSTPPSQLNNLPALNPFEKALTDSLHMPVFSPSVFTNVVSPTQDGQQFCWTIEDISILKPASIEQSAEHVDHVESDPEVESRAQEAIHRFFQCHPVVPSPWGEPVPKVYPSRCFEEDENKLKEEHFKFDEESKRKNNICLAKVNVSSQTVLSLPPVLPREVEEVLKPFFSTGEGESRGVASLPTKVSFRANKNRWIAGTIDDASYRTGLAEKSYETEEADDSFMNTSTLRRKLLFHEDMNASPYLSSVQSGLLRHSPYSQMMLFPSTPIVRHRSYDTNHEISPPQFSPIVKNDCQLRRNKSSTRLDFSMNMSIDSSPTELSSVERPQQEYEEKALVPFCASLSSNPVTSDTGYSTASFSQDTLSENNLVPLKLLS